MARKKERKKSDALARSCMASRAFSGQLPARMRVAYKERERRNGKRAEGLAMRGAKKKSTVEVHADRGLLVL